MKRTMNRIDYICFRGFLRLIYLKILRTWKFEVFSNQFSHKFITYYDPTYSKYLSQLCDFYGSDKGGSNESKSYEWPSHTYVDYYSRIFQNRNNVFNVFECGIGTNNPNLPSSMGTNGKPGASLRVWRDYFPNAQVIGVDIDREILFQENRIKTYYVDQLDAETIVDFWKLLGKSSFDVMIDDGLHTFAAGHSLFINSIRHLAKNGVYIIEDVTVHDLNLYKAFFDKEHYLVEYINLVSPNSKVQDNFLITVKNY